MSGILLQNGKQAFTDANGHPLSGGRVFSYVPNTSTLKDTWQDAAQTIPNTNPIILDARGEASIYGSGPYRQVLRDASLVQIWDAFIPDLVGSIQTAINDLYLKSAVQVVNVAALRLLDKTIYRNAQTSGYYARADHGDGFYTLDLTDTTSVDNGGTIIVAADGGRWKLNYNGVLSVRQFGAKGDGVADDTLAIQSTYNMFPNGSGHVRLPLGVYNYTLLTFDSSIGLRLEGDGAINTSTLRCTSALATDGVKIRSSFDCTAEFITFDHSSAAFTGYLVDLSHKPASSTDTQGMRFKSCTFASQGFGLYTAKGVQLNQATLVSFRDCKFGSLLRPIDGQNPLGGGYANGIRFEDCQSFDNVGYFANYLGEQWTFKDCNFQACHDGAQRICFSDNTTTWRGLNFDNVSVYDATIAGPAMLNLGKGSSLTVNSGLWGGRGDLGVATWLNATGIINGITSKGSVYSLFDNICVAGVAGNVGWDMSGGNTFVNCTTMLVNPQFVTGACFDLNAPPVSLGVLPLTSASNSLRYNQDGSIDITGVWSVPAGAGTVMNFHTAFPSACWDVQLTMQAPAAVGNILYKAATQTAAGVSVAIAGSGTSTVCYRAIGI